MTWRVNMEPVIALGGGRALVLQVLHPSVAAGVDHHSNFEQDPFSRGFRTIDMMLKLGFADAATSKRQAELLERIHRRVKGVRDDGVPYDALDPSLLLWVWATLIDASLVIYQRCVGPLSDLDLEHYYQEQKLVAYAAGVPRGGCPATYRDFLDYFQRTMDNELAVNDVARVVTHAARNPPLPGPLGPAAGLVLTFLTAGLLPDRFRHELGYAWSGRKERLMRLAMLSCRTLAVVLPTALRHLPNRYLIRRKTPLAWFGQRPVAPTG